MDLNTNDAYAALRIVDYRRFITARFLITFAIQMQSVVIGWQIYQITHDALSLGLIGMAEAIPFLGVTLFAGHIADLVDRKYIILLSNLVYFICTIALLLISTVLQPLLSSFGPMPIYMVIFITGLARGFLSPAQSAFAAQLVPKELFGNASTWNSVAWQVAEVGGPAIGGLICGFWGFAAAYFFVMTFSAIGWLFFFFVKKRPVPVKAKDETIWESLSSGLKFVFGNQIILSAISLDMFAVFFGGAISVLPIFADQVLHTGAKGLGFLRAAPAVGAIMMSLVQAYWPPFKKAGRNLLICVFGFGVCIILFAISKSFYLTMFILMVSGMFDNVSVIIRATIIQIYTPDEMRGRVSAVNGIFIGSSNELGSFESGLAAKLLGLIPSVIFGGSMTLAVVTSVRKLAPKLRRLSF
ncbi:MAG: MFS transporter [Clostridiales bacterium]